MTFNHELTQASVIIWVGHHLGHCTVLVHIYYSSKLNYKLSRRCFQIWTPLSPPLFRRRLLNRVFLTPSNTQRRSASGVWRNVCPSASPIRNAIPIWNYGWKLQQVTCTSVPSTAASDCAALCERQETEERRKKNLEPISIGLPWSLLHASLQCGCGTKRTWKYISSATSWWFWLGIRCWSPRNEELRSVWQLAGLSCIPSPFQQMIKLDTFTTWRLRSTGSLFTGHTQSMWLAWLLKFYSAVSNPS